MDSIFEAIRPLSDAGFALHWLHPRTKRPIGEKWQDAARLDFAGLQATHAPGNNVGVRLGLPSASGGLYLHAIDLDIRIPDLADEAWNALQRLLPEIDLDDLPCVASGSGGESRHLYFLTEKPFFGRKLAVSEGKHRRSTGQWSYDWEVELFGTGKQVALPPSIHPDTGKPYTWERAFDFDMLDLGIAPTIPAADLEGLATAQSESYEFESREPLEFKPGQLERDLDDIDISELDYDDWVRLGQALHHQFGGAEEGFQLWLETTKRSIKYTGDAQARDMRRSKWRSFGRYRGKPVTMGTIRQWAIDARSERTIAELLGDAEDDDFDDETEDSVSLDGDSLDDLIGTPAPKQDLIEDPSTPAPNDWLSLLDYNDEGGIRPTLHNLEMIVINDPRLAGVPQLNQFTQETVQRVTPGKQKSRRKNPAKQTRQLEGGMWVIHDTLNGELWSDDRDFAIRSILEAPKTQGGYGLKVSDRDLKAAIVLSADRSPFHPVREYLTSHQWDGVPRCETLFIDYFKTPDNAYYRDVARLMMMAAVTRIVEPGHKFDYAVILEGLQGKRKSTFISTLGKSWFAELDGDFHNPKEMIELMQGRWILELPELTGFQRSDVRAIKAFISRQKDRARLAYARRAGEFPRQCIFIGSTNDRQYLKDDTGGRRFWPVQCSVADDSEIDTDRLEQNVDQLWAEAYHLYQEARLLKPVGTLPLFLQDARSRDYASRLQESRRVESADDGVAGQIEDWLSRPVFSGDLDDEAEGGLRQMTCLMQVFVEALGGDIRSYGQQQAQQLGRAMARVRGWHLSDRREKFPSPYGRQRVYLPNH